MRFILISFLVLFGGNGYSQIKETDLSDTAIVRTSIGDADTSFWINDPHRVGEWVVYYDSTHLQKALHVIYYESKYRYISTEWFKSGQIKREKFGRYYLTPLHYNEWFQDGKIKASSKCSGDSCVNTRYYHNGQLAEKSIARGDTGYQNMMVWCYVEEYYENGQLKYTPNNPNHKSRTTIVSYYSSGKIKTQVDVMSGGAIGPYKEWFESGQLKMNANFAEFSDDGHFHEIKTGKWTYYDETGKKIKEEFW